ncbi:nucleotidyltransferase domain-containing protein [Tritonibacter horizontis]|uniref:Nucleotidyltransferase n=1 Tax=Tritonibacter horizontis TaxID=1768241 RepID=A0A132BYR7_9RHOB|nr:nucleotidyltransferase family protein [Tritonibacter horizontis]KUP93533.1 hypothetical protein TRIHO_15560 [Tritonibacter horizontis]
MVDFTAQTAEVRLQILLAKAYLAEPDIALAQRLMAEIGDWEAFVRSAHRNFSLPLLQRHIVQLDPTGISPEIRTMMQQTAMQTALRNMKLVASQRKFLNTCLKPAGLPAIFFKGINLAAQYYPDLGLRPSRDIDVLVPSGSLHRVVEKAMSEGYTLVAPDTQIRAMTSSQDVDAVLRLCADVSLLTPEGTVLDLQQKLDKHSGIFARYDIFARAATFSLGGEDFQTMPPAFLFNYLCHHHSRHTWSRLHWLSDLDAICSSPHFDPEDALALADQLGQRGTVEAGLELRALMSGDTPWDNGPAMAHGKAFLDLAIRNLPGDLRLEKKISLTLKGGEFMFDWQAKPELIAKARRNWWRSIFKPTLKQYVQMPLPKNRQWIYYIPRFFQLLHETATRLTITGRAG